MTLLQEIARTANVERAFRLCLNGKRDKLSPQLAFLNLDVYLTRLRAELLKGEDYRWGPYREFYVADPKRRLISSAPFIDRVAHRAIYNVLNPVLDRSLIETTFACRDGRGNGRAVSELYRTLNSMDEFWVVKLDVAKYFASIDHGRLKGKLFSYFNDESVTGLIKGLLRNHPEYAHGRGLPLGNLTSQIFANFYLSEIDHQLITLLEGRYFRYMDDIVLVGKTEGEARQAMKLTLELGRREKLKFPMRKRYWLGRNGPVPFLGFRVGKDLLAPLNRNRRRMGRRMREKARQGALPSEIHASLLSYEAWLAYPQKLIRGEVK